MLIQGQALYGCSKIFSLLKKKEKKQVVELNGYKLPINGLNHHQDAPIKGLQS